MEKPQFMPHEATEAQRREIMERSFGAGRAQGAIITPHTEAAYERYIVGEISLDHAIDQALSVYQLTAANA